MGKGTTVSILLVRTLGQQRVKSQGQSQVAGKYQRWDLYPDDLVPNPPFEFYSLWSRGRKAGWNRAATSLQVQALRGRADGNTRRERLASVPARFQGP